MSRSRYYTDIENIGDAKNPIEINGRNYKLYSITSYTYENLADVATDVSSIEKVEGPNDMETITYAETATQQSLYDMNFAERQGYDKWLEIKAYDFSEGTVTTPSYSSVYTYCFCDTYFYYSKGSNGELTDVKEYIEFYTLIDDETIVYHNNLYSWAITSRVVNSRNNWVVIKTVKDGYESWYIPIEMIDQSVAPVYGKGDYTYQLKK